MINWTETREIFSNGTWKQNSSLVQMLGMCPLLAMTTSLVNGAMLSLATIFVMGLSGFVVSCLRNFIPHEIRIVKDCSLWPYVQCNRACIAQVS